VFDGRREFGCDGNSSVTAGTAATASQQQGQQQAGAADDSHVLMGVTSQARVGLLTLFEWYRYVEVSGWLPLLFLCACYMGSCSTRSHHVAPYYLQGLQSPVLLGCSSTLCIDSARQALGLVYMSVLLQANCMFSILSCTVQ
jgi:hypothetical protein